MSFLAIILAILGLYVQYLIIKAAIDGSETAQNIREIKQYFVESSNGNKANVTFDADDSDYDYDHCPDCGANLATNDIYCPSCGLSLGNNQ